MKHYRFIFLFILLSSCQPPADHSGQMQTRIDSLEKKLKDTYKPGLGEFMSGIQIHHAKLWFAGLNENWKLADFEIDEIKEALEAIPKYCPDRSEVQSLPMINAPTDSVKKAIDRKDLILFKQYYTLLTNTCNACHKNTNHEFNVIQIPESPPFSNQKFGAEHGGR
jgi:hypothetical protein